MMENKQKARATKTTNDIKKPKRHYIEDKFEEWAPDINENLSLRKTALKNKLSVYALVVIVWWWATFFLYSLLPHMFYMFVPVYVYIIWTIYYLIHISNDGCCCCCCCMFIVLLLRRTDTENIRIMIPFFYLL